MSALVREVTVPAQGGRAVEASAGETVEVVDLDGHQVGDLWVIDAGDHRRWLSTSHTRDRIERLFPALGQAFTDQRGEPIVTLIADTSPGRHDMLFPPCDRWLYDDVGLPDHPNCRDNFLAAAATAGVSLPIVPDPVNLFQNSAPAPDGTLTVHTAASLPGDSVMLRLARDAIVVLTACSVDYWPTNNQHPTPMLIRLPTITES